MITDAHAYDQPRSLIKVLSRYEDDARGTSRSLNGTVCYSVCLSPLVYSHSNTMPSLSRTKFIVCCRVPSRSFSIACTRGDCKSGDRYVSSTEQRTCPHNGTTLYVKRVCYVYVYIYTYIHAQFIHQFILV